MPVVSFFLYLAVSTVIFAAAIYLYTLVTPYDEFEQVRSGNVAVAVSLAGAMLGFSLPLANLIAHSSSIAQVLTWSVFTLGAQLLTYFFTDKLLLKKLRARIERGEVASGVFLAAISVTIGLINAACLTA